MGDPYYGNATTRLAHEIRGVADRLREAMEVTPHVPDQTVLTEAIELDRIAEELEQ